MQSILNSIKKLLGIAPEYTAFDADITMHINTTFTILTQLGVGPSEGFSITDENTVWTDFMDETPKLESIKTYVYLRVRLLFDPPLSSSVMESMTRAVSELEWRINVAAESA